jgi:hypothetical protein
MAKNISGLLTFGALLTTLSICLVAQARKEMPLAIDYGPPPESWEQLAKDSDAVAIVQLRSRLTQEKQRARALDIVSRFSAEVIEILKDNERFPLQGMIDIYRAGGAVDTPDGRVNYVEQRFPQWVPGMRILVFLDWRDNDAGYVPVLGPDGSFELDQKISKVRTYGLGPLARAQKDRELNDFVADLRKRIKK